MDGLHQMNQLHTALTFSLWSLEFILLPPLNLILVIATISVVLAALKQRRIGLQFGQLHYGVLLHLLFFPAAIAVGLLLPASNINGRHSSPNRFGNTSVYILLYASFASCVFWIWKMKGLRWLAASLMALMELPVLGALFVAGMSVTGDWL